MTRAALVGRLQRSGGNHSVQQLARRAALAREPAAQPDATRPSLSDLRTMAELWIDVYNDGARDGLVDLETMIGAQADYGPLLAALAGNLIWAAACFTTGGTAFVISLVGIGVGMEAPVFSGKLDVAAFHKHSVAVIDGVVAYLKSRIVAVTDAVDAEAEREGLGDTETRRRLVGRLLLPQYVDDTPLPTADRSAIARSVTAELLRQANAYEATLRHPWGGGRFIYAYTGSDMYTSTTPGWNQDTYEFKPFDAWRIEPRATSVYIPQGGEAALEFLKGQPVVKPTEMSWATRIEVYDAAGSDDALTLDFDAAGALAHVSGSGRFQQVLDARFDPGAVAPWLWAAAGGRAPDVATAGLELTTWPTAPVHEIGE